MTFGTRSHARRARLVAVLALLALSAGFAAVSAPPAAAAHRVQYGLTDDAWLLNGPGTLSERIASLQSLGVKVVRFTLEWNVIAPSRPTDATDPADQAYDWSADDSVLDGLHAAGISVVLQLLSTPGWANGGLPPNYAPTSGATFRAFAEAAARRYSWVKRWLIWNEPNQVRWLRPTKASVYTTRLLNPAYAAIHATVAGAQVGGGVTAPRGATEGVSPIAWIAGMHAAHAHLDAYAHNPYPLNPNHETPLTGGCSHCQTITMATIGRLVTLVGRDFGHARIWLTEYGYQTNPPDKILGVSPALQARYVGEGLYQAYRTPRVDLLIHYLYRDEPDIARFQSGLVRLNNVRKPAYSAFELPLVETARSGSTPSLWGALRAPGINVARLEQRSGAGWTTLATVSAGVGGYFRWQGTLPRGSSVRLNTGSLAGAAITIL
jgi:hypothetical protein